MFTIKKIGSVVGFCTLLLGSIHAQTTNHSHAPGRSCYAHDKLQEQLQQDPALQQRMDDIENTTQRYIQSVGQARNTSTRSIPVYVHVIYRTSQENISTAQIQSQLDQLNADFAATNADYNPPSDFASVASGNTNIQYTLAGITRQQNSKTSWGTNDAMKNPSQGGVAAVTPSTHLNMWVCNIGGGILGYAQFPGGAASTDGVVMSPQYFGSNNYGSGYYLSAPYDKGRTATHEVGHYLNLRHIWGDGGCSVDDYVDDTPVAGSSNGGCPSNTTNTCSGGQRDMFMNYMDYVQDDCMFMFSAGQGTRIWACLNTTRAQLGTSGGGGGTPPACTDNEVTLNLNFDNYASETSWTLKNSAGQTVESGSGYANGDASIAEIFCLPAGCYDFTINDSYGDGICCSYGNGSYSLVAADGTTISGASFTSTETKQICVGPPPPPACTDVTINVNFDNYGSETSWTLKNSAGQTVESGSGYTNSSANVSETYCLDAGCYTFTINDSYGDGICCSYGNGSYSLTSGGSSLASGASFTSSESKQICVGSARTTNQTAAKVVEVVAMEMNLYPNPATSVLNIDIFNHEGTCVGRIMDATGKTLWAGDLEEGNNQVNLNQLATGIYYFNAVKQDGTTITKKFVKNN